MLDPWRSHGRWRSQSPSPAPPSDWQALHGRTSGSTTTIWNITTQCNAERTCGGTVSTSAGWVGAISRLAGGPWTAERRDVPNGWTCPDGSTGPADLLYSFDPASLVGTVN